MPKSLINATLSGYKKTPTIFRITLDITDETAARKAMLVLANCSENQEFGLVPLTPEAAKAMMVADFMGEDTEEPEIVAPPKPSKPAKKPLCASAVAYKADYNRNPSNLAHLQCEEPHFWQFIERTNTYTGVVVANFDQAKDYVLRKCAIESFTEIDSDQDTCIMFLTITKQYRIFVRDFIDE